MFSRPAFVVAICLAVGLTLRRYLPCDPVMAGSIIAAIIFCAILARIFFITYFFPLFLIAVMASGYALGIFSLRVDDRDEDILAELEDTHEHLIYATVDNDPAPRLDGITFRAVLHGVHDSAGTQPLNDVKAHVFCLAGFGDTLPEIRRGDRLALFAKVRAPRGVRNPGDFDDASYQRVQGVLAEVTVRSQINIERFGSDPPNVIIATIENVRHKIANVLDRFVGGEEGDVLKGLLIGERGELSDETREMFVATGTFHVLAVSGLHVAFVAMILFGVLSPILNRYIHTALWIAGLLTFAVLAGGAPSLLRAVLMATLAATGILLERRLDALNIIGGAATILMIAEPAKLFSAGFQLSFAAAIGLALMLPRMRSLLVRGSIARHLWLRRGVELACASFAAQCATLPLTAIYFERLSPAGIVANLLVVPASGVALGAALLVAVASPLPWLAQLFGDAAKIFVHEVLQLMTKIAELPFASITVAPLSLIEIYIFYCAVLFVLFAATRIIFFKRIAVVMIGWCAYQLAFPHAIILERGALTVAALDVGQGDGIVIGFPNGRVLLVDAGPDHPTHRAALPVAMFLQRENIRHVDALVLTHLHGDHIGGAVDVLRRVTVDTIYHSGQRVADERVHILDSVAMAMRVPMRRVRDGEMLSLDTAVRVYVLHPDSLAVAADGWTVDGNLNNGSVVLKVVFGATSILLSGDLEREREAALIGRYGNFLQSDILKTGHHGSKTSTTPEYLATVRPREAIISVGENKFGHPSPSVIARLNAGGITVDRTDESGAVVWRSDGNTWKKVLWR